MRLSYLLSGTLLILSSTLLSQCTKYLVPLTIRVSRIYGIFYDRKREIDVPIIDLGEVNSFEVS